MIGKCSSCKSWQMGFNPKSEIDAILGNKTRRGRAAWQAFRELVAPKWSEAFVDAIKRVSAADQFTHVTAVTRLVGDRAAWENHESFRRAMVGNPLKIWTFSEMVTEIRSSLTTTLAATEVGRLLQLFAAARMMPPGR